MTEYVYRLTTNTPVGASTGAGGVPDVHHSTMPGGNVDAVGSISKARSTAVSASDGHTFELELVEIRSDLGPDVDAWIAQWGLNLDAWQRAHLIQMIERVRRSS